VVLSWLDSLFGLLFKKHCKKSPLGRNARFCAIRFGFLPFDIGQYKLNRTCSFASKFASSLTAGFMDRASFAYEVITIREGQFTTMHHDASLYASMHLGKRLTTLLLTWLRDFSLFL